MDARWILGVTLPKASASRYASRRAAAATTSDGVETLADGRTVVKVRVRAIADGGEANRAVSELIAKALGVPKARVRILSGMTSRLKQIAIDGDPATLGEALRKVIAAKPANLPDKGSR
jgi:uncharacterized protein YggU (UPF0235/DUF167 family)